MLLRRRGIKTRQWSMSFLLPQKIRPSSSIRSLCPLGSTDRRDRFLRGTHLVAGLGSHLKLITGPLITDSSSPGSCLLPPASYLLPPASCLLPLAHHFPEGKSKIAHRFQPWEKAILEIFFVPNGTAELVRHPMPDSCHPTARLREGLQADLPVVRMPTR